MFCLLILSIVIVLACSPTASSSLTGLHQLGVTSRKDLLGPPLEFIPRRDIAQGTVVPFGIILMNVVADKPPGVVQRQGRLGTKTLAFETLMPSFDFSIALRVVRTRPHVRHPAETNKGLKIPGDKGRTVIRDDPRMHIRIGFPCPLQNDFHVRFGHRFPNLPVDNVPAVAVQDGAQIVKRPGDIDIRHIHMPVLMRLQRLPESGALARRAAVIPTLEQTGVREHPIGRAGADGHDVGIEHHVRQTTISLAGMRQKVIHDRLFLLVLKPKVSGNPVVMLVDPAIAFLPVVEFASGNPDPANQCLFIHLGSIAPVSYVIHHVVSNIRFGPGVFQPRPSSFFKRTWSAAISAITSSLWASLALS